MSDCKEMPKYKSHKEVRALKIAKIEPALGNRPSGPGEDTDGGLIITPAEEGYAQFRVEREYVHKHFPQVGGYYVVYKDGYTSWSPSKQFEEGYTRIQEVFAVDPTFGAEASRELDSHKVAGLNEAITIKVLDEPGQGNACHRYFIEIRDGDTKLAGWPIEFQNGPVAESGPNGISNEALLAIVEDRLAGFQSGEFACYENESALDSVRGALAWLNIRTQDRIDRGVEGKNIA